ncbi:MAG: hypothetical protein M0D55_03580 [Elusimicrobiota bacterium]|nr:MAG: hypothetical protein M0D55_03580 [Elusimicrobiota bacterium]
MAEEPVVYRIDAQDRIVSAGPAWDRFAVANASPHLVSEKIVSRSLWDFITDTTTRLLYRDLLKRARAGNALSFPFRCDSSETRRFLEMTANAAGDGSVEFKVRTLAVEKRAPQPLLESGARSAEPALRMCGWCKKMPVGDAWIEVEQAVATLRLLEAPVLPAVSHGICEDCERRMREVIDRAAKPSN